jgi:hypothetical protein
MQGLLFGNAVDRWLIGLEEPATEQDEIACTEALYEVAADFRLYGKEEHEHYDYQPETMQEAMPSTDYARGFSDGYEGFVPGVFANQKNKEYLAGHAEGSAKRMSEYRSTCNETFQTEGMVRGADCRVVKFNLGRT